jgi:MFS family permease
MGDKLGRKTSLIITGIVYEAGSVMQVASQGNTAVMFLGRAIGGLVSPKVFILPNLT